MQQQIRRERMGSLQKLRRKRKLLMGNCVKDELLLENG
jgi:hypothetical protein